MTRRVPRLVRQILRVDRQAPRVDKRVLRVARIVPNTDTFYAVLFCYFLFSVVNYAFSFSAFSNFHETHTHSKCLLKILTLL